MIYHDNDGTSDFTMVLYYGINNYEVVSWLAALFPQMTVFVQVKIVLYFFWNNYFGSWFPFGNSGYSLFFCQFIQVYRQLKKLIFYLCNGSSLTKLTKIVLSWHIIDLQWFRVFSNKLLIWSKAINPFNTSNIWV